MKNIIKPISITPDRIYLSMIFERFKARISQRYNYVLFYELVVFGYYTAKSNSLI